VMHDVRSGSYSIPCTHTAGAGFFEGWSLLGNPYPCSIDPNLILWDPMMMAAIYFWDSNTLSYMAWVAGMGPNIPSTQGFFVETFGNCDFTLTGDERVHDPGGFFYDEKIEDLLILEALGNRYADKTYIRFTDEATMEFDRNWDAHKLLSPADIVPQLYTNHGEDIYAINSMPETNFVALCFESGQGGKFSIKTIEKTNFSSVILEDLVTNKYCDILTETYDFEYQPEDDPQRFRLHFNKDIQ
ncbi:MAG: hypothetical protein K8R53_00090, partial [Bacteroidales bacterium]|nr:hypothetical protein [Bacteroidales bacterium]